MINMTRCACYLALVLSLCLLSCSSREKKQLQLQNAFLAGQQEAMMQAQSRQAGNQQPSVTVKGEVQRPTVPWVPGLTLAKAIVAANYMGKEDPKKILLTRAGETHEVRTDRLLNGLEDPELLVGDVIELVK